MIEQLEQEPSGDILKGELHSNIVGDKGGDATSFHKGGDAASTTKEDATTVATFVPGKHSHVKGKKGVKEGAWSGAWSEWNDMTKRGTSKGGFEKQARDTTSSGKQSFKKGGKGKDPAMKQSDGAMHNMSRTASTTGAEQQFYSGSNNMNNDFYTNPCNNEAVKLSLSEALSDDQLEKLVKSGREEEAGFKEFLQKCGSMGPTAEFDRSCNPEKFARRERQAEQQRKKPFGGYAMQILYMRYLEYAQLRKKIDLNIAINNLANNGISENDDDNGISENNGIHGKTSSSENAAFAKINFQALGVHIPLDRNDSTVGSSLHINNQLNASANSELGIPLTIDIEALARLQRETVDKNSSKQDSDTNIKQDEEFLDTNQDAEGRLDLGHPLIQLQLSKHNQVSQCFPWVHDERIRKFLRETEATSLEEARELALPKNAPVGPTPYEQQYVIPVGGKTPLMNLYVGGEVFNNNYVNHFGSAYTSNPNATVDLPITEKPIPISLFAAQQRAKCLGEKLPSAQNLVVPTDLGPEVMHEALNTYAQLVAIVNEGNFSDAGMHTRNQTPSQTPAARNEASIPTNWGPPPSYQPTTTTSTRKPEQKVFLGQQHVNPGQQQVIPGHQQVIPGQQQVIPGQQQVIIPGQQQVIIPGQQQVIIPGHRRVMAGQDGSSVALGAQKVLRIDEEAAGDTTRILGTADNRPSSTTAEDAKSKNNFPWGKPDSQKPIDIAELAETLCMHVERLGSHQLLQWDKGRDIVELEHSLIIESCQPVESKNVENCQAVESKNAIKEADGIMSNTAEAGGGGDNARKHPEDCSITSPRIKEPVGTMSSTSNNLSATARAKPGTIVSFELGEDDVQNLLLIHQSTSEREAMFDRRVANVGERLVEKYTGNRSYELLRQTYRLRNVGINPHECRLFKKNSKPLSNQTIKALVRHIKEKQVSTGKLVLRNQTRIATKHQLVTAMLGGKKDNSAEIGSNNSAEAFKSATSDNSAEFDILLKRLRIVVSVHSAIELSKVSLKWTEFFKVVDWPTNNSTIPVVTTPSLEDSLRDAMIIFDEGSYDKKHNAEMLTLLRAFIDKVDWLTISKINGKEYLEEKKLDLSEISAEIGLEVGLEGGFFDD